jgi:hypothetical protein
MNPFSHCPAGSFISCGQIKKGMEENHEVTLKDFII